MSIPNITNYLINNSNYPANTDLINVFGKNSSIVTNPNILTKYKYNTYDLSQIFVLVNPAFSGTAPLTGYNTIINGTSYDLSKVFQQKFNYTITGQYTILNDSIITFTGNGTITFGATYNINYILVGGGGGGAGGQLAGGGAGGGGGGGQVLYSSTPISVTNGLVFSITIGSGGAGGLGQKSTNVQTSGTNGSNSLFTYDSTTITALGGYGGYAGYNDSGNGGDSGGGGVGGLGGFNVAGTPGTNGGGGGGGDYGYNGGTGAPNTLTNPSFMNQIQLYGAGGGAGAGNAGTKVATGGNQYAGSGGYGAIKPTSGINGYGGGGGGGTSGNGVDGTATNAGSGGSGTLILYLSY